jgi:SAM-dependent methyltransferase
VTDDASLPPRRLTYRVGCPRTSLRPLQLYVQRGAEFRTAIESFLPPNWSFTDRRVLDFGCGAGRVLRHFLPDGTRGEFWGCDIDERSIRWVQDHLCPPLHAYRCGDVPPLPHPAGYFDLVLALSVLTHITDSWSAWLVELHRILADDGLLLATFMGEGVIQGLIGEPWDEDRIGMNVVRSGRDWSRGGPMVLHSPWWIRAHWGRAFEVVELTPSGFARDSPVGQGAVLLRKKPVTVTTDDLERWEPDEPRELEAMRHNLRQLQREVAALRDSRSWRFTQPLRDLLSVSRTLRAKLRRSSKATVGQVPSENRFGPRRTAAWRVTGVWSSSPRRREVDEA